MGQDEKRITKFLQFDKINIPKPYESRETEDDKYVVYGDKLGYYNLYPLFLLKLYNESAIHSSIINVKSSYIVGDGLKLKGGEEFNIQVNAQDTFSELVDKVVKDYLIFNYVAIEVVYNAMNEPIEYHHTPAHNIRINKSKNRFWHCDDWVYKKDIINFDVWRPNSIDGKSTMFFFDGNNPSPNRVYPVPDYNAALTPVAIDVAITEFNLNNIKNHFSVSTIISFFEGANVSEEVMDETERRLADSYTGEQGKKMILNFLAKDGTPPKVENISPNDWDKCYTLIKQTNEDTIYSGHQVTSPMLIGVKTAGQLGGATELETSYEIFKSNYIQGKRKEIERALSRLFKTELEFADRPLFKNVLSDSLKEKVLTINEIRKTQGLPPIEGGERLPIETVKSVSVGASVGAGDLSSGQPVNSILTNLTGKQHQHIMRIVRKFNKGSMTQQQAMIELKNGFGFTDELCLEYLGINDETQLSEERKLSEKDFEKIAHLGIVKDEFEIVGDGENFNAIALQFDAESDIADYVIKNDIKGLTIDEVKILIRKDLGLQITSKELTKTLKNLNDAGVIKVEESGGKINIKPPVKPNLPNTRELEIYYSYEVRPGLGAPLIENSRGFCVQLVNNDRLYTREDIQTMSSIFGYDIYEYTGGYYYNPNNDKTTPFCRHYWKSNTVVKKTK